METDLFLQCDKRKEDEEGEEEVRRKGQREMTPCDKQRVKIHDALKGSSAKLGESQGILKK